MREDLSWFFSSFSSNNLWSHDPLKLLCRKFSRYRTAYLLHSQIHKDRLTSFFFLTNFNGSTWWNQFSDLKSHWTKMKFASCKPLEFLCTSSAFHQIEWNYCWGRFSVPCKVIWESAKVPKGFSLKRRNVLWKNIFALPCRRGDDGEGLKHAKRIFFPSHGNYANLMKAKFSD